MAFKSHFTKIHSWYNTTPRIPCRATLMNFFEILIKLNFTKF